ncbi:MULTISPECIES: DNA recombination protein RmuC [unclassified Roseitalea]|uniref:DNA recombination protein RmuC n=1 Tax=unclassified Roseitalea TaxID=2639107 RepID=UPI00273FE88D|nr:MULTISPECIES: DNA recombination protein RmuC [unclassified Roseitalea]
MESGFAWSAPALEVGGRVVTLGESVLAVAVILAAITALGLWRAAARHRRALAAERVRAQQAEARVSEILSAQSDMQGRLSAMAEVFGARHSEMSATLEKRLDAMTSRIGQSISEQQKSAHDNLSKLHERLAVIDTAQSNIQQLAGQVVELQSILSNKQTRGAFGQSRMEAIIEDGLPMGAYGFQVTLSNGSRPDCVVSMPNGAPGLVIDAKFPLEAWNAFHEAREDGARTEAARQFRRDMEVHIKAIAEKYLIAGETQDTAFLFVPSESIFADIHENHEAVVQRAHKARVVIVSPSLLMLSIQVIQALLKDARMREQAHLIQGEVLRLMEDLNRLDDRVRKLSTHFGQASKDIDDILVSTDKLTKRGRKIEGLEFDEPSGSGQAAGGDDRTAQSKTGGLRLRVVDGEPE